MIFNIVFGIWIFVFMMSLFVIEDSRTSSYGIAVSLVVLSVMAIISKFV